MKTYNSLVRYLATTLYEHDFCLHCSACTTHLNVAGLVTNLVDSFLDLHVDLKWMLVKHFCKQPSDFKGLIHFQQMLSYLCDDILKLIMKRRKLLEG